MICYCNFSFCIMLLGEFLHVFGLRNSLKTSRGESGSSECIKSSTINILLHSLISWKSSGHVQERQFLKKPFILIDTLALNCVKSSTVSAEGLIPFFLSRTRRQRRRSRTVRRVAWRRRPGCLPVPRSNYKQNEDEKTEKEILTVRGAVRKWNCKFKSSF